MKPILTLAGLVVLPLILATGCISTQTSEFLPPEHGWELCRNELPVDLSAIDPVARADAELGGQWEELHRAHLVAAIGYALANRCTSGDIPGERIGAFDRIVVLGNDNANQVMVYGGGDNSALRSRALYIETPLYTDFRTDAFDADLDNGVLCYFASAAIDATSCLPD
ncbi:MAG: hypothetical protein HKN78_11920 [Sphingomonadaceae bacterium]|nr:hypothetical protein [Sphingomonadaceae bacterium]